MGRLIAFALLGAVATLIAVHVDPSPASGHHEFNPIPATTTTTTTTTAPRQPEPHVCKAINGDRRGCWASNGWTPTARDVQANNVRRGLPKYGGVRVDATTEDTTLARCPDDRGWIWDVDTGDVIWTCPGDQVLTPYLDGSEVRTRLGRIDCGTGDEWRLVSRVRYAPYKGYDSAVVSTWELYDRCGRSTGKTDTTTKIN